MTRMTVPGKRSLKIAVLEYFSVLMERKEEIEDGIILLCLGKGFYL